MAQDTQAITLVGRVGQEPEGRFLGDGTAVTNFSLACNNRDGSTTWYRVAAFGKLGEICNEYLHKGKQVFIQGDYSFRTYEKKDGGEGYSHEVRAVTMQMLGSKQDDTEGTQEPAVAPQRAQSQRNAPTQQRTRVQTIVDAESEDLPF